MSEDFMESEDVVRLEIACADLGKWLEQEGRFPKPIEDVLQHVMRFEDLDNWFQLISHLPRSTDGILQDVRKIADPLAGQSEISTGRTLVFSDAGQDDNTPVAVATDTAVTNRSYTAVAAFHLWAKEPTHSSVFWWSSTPESTPNARVWHWSVKTVSGLKPSRRWALEGAGRCHCMK
jgi:hypothetical protein